PLTRRRAAALVLLCIVPSLWISTIATARPPSEIAPLGPDAFRPIVLAPDPTGEVADAHTSIPARAVPRRGPILDFPVAAQVPASRPNVSLPSTVKSSVKKAPT